MFSAGHYVVLIKCPFCFFCFFVFYFSAFVTGINTGEVPFIVSHISVFDSNVVSLWVTAEYFLRQPGQIQYGIKGLA